MLSETTTYRKLIYFIRGENVMNKNNISIQKSQKEEYDGLRKVFLNTRQESFKRLGVGKALINESVKAVGLPLTLKCIKANVNALNFYLSQGWTIEEEVTENEPYCLMKYEGINVLEK